MLTGRRQQRAGRAGFTTVELLIALVIVAILLSAAAMIWRSARTHARHAEVATTALDLRNGVEAFRAQAGGMVPQPPGDATDWPVAANGPSATQAGIVRRFMTRTPEPLQNGNVDIVAAPTAGTVPTGKHGRLVFARTGDTSYTISAYVDGATAPICVLSESQAACQGGCARTPWPDTRASPSSR